MLIAFIFGVQILALVSVFFCAGIFLKTRNFLFSFPFVFIAIAIFYGLTANPNPLYSFSCQYDFNDLVMAASWTKIISFIYLVLRWLVYLFPVFSVVISIFLIYRTKNKNYWWLLISFIFLAITIFLFGSMSANYRSRSIDARRIGDLRQIQNGLELYYNAFKKYPGLSATTKAERWEEFSSIIVKSNIGLNQVPRDPGRDCFYEYGFSPDGQNYVLKTTLQDPTNAILDGDIDDEVYSIWCGKQGFEVEYCVSL